MSSANNTDERIVSLNLFHCHTHVLFWIISHRRLFPFFQFNLCHPQQRRRRRRRSCLHMIRNASAWSWANGRVSFWFYWWLRAERATVLLMLRPFEVALFFNAVPFATRSFDLSRPFEVALFFNSLRPFEVALLFNAVPFKDADTAARSFERPGATLQSGTAIRRCSAFVQSAIRRSIHPYRLLLPGNHLL